MAKPIMRWGVLWRQRNRLGGLTEHLMFDNTQLVLFITRCEAREWIDKNYGFIRTRPDLRREPHGWRVPRPVKVPIGWIK